MKVRVCWTKQDYDDKKKLEKLNYIPNRDDVYMLNLSLNELTSLEGLEFPKYLQILYLNDNKIIDVSDLSNLVNLQILALSYNKITDVSALSNLVNLRLLWLHNNKITDVSALSNFVNLQILYLSYNQITDVSALSNLINLQILYLNNNPFYYSPLLSDIHGNTTYITDHMISDHKDNVEEGYIAVWYYYETELLGCKCSMRRIEIVKID